MSSTLHREIHFETEICQHLGAHGWLHEDGAARDFDTARGLYLPDLLAWVEASQPEAWQRLTKSHGVAAGRVLAERVRKLLDERGTLEVLRRGVEMLGLREPLALAQFRPALALNPTTQARLAANRLRVLRQVHHSPNQPRDALDLVLCLNGVPVATAELKSDFTQSVHDAVDQYRFDRHPHPKGGVPEPVLGFPGGALVHFAVSQSEVMMCTRLAGAATRFLPFNRGCEGGAGNPPNPEGFATAYLWEEVWARESWLDLLHRYLTPRRDRRQQLQTWIFPRYHQLDATRRLVDDVRQSVNRGEDAGGLRYLIQHSAGSGKTNSIAWAAHFLADLHDDQHRKVFDSVLVVSDRNVLDAQLQEALFEFQRTTGVVATITSESGSKSGQLSQALEEGKKIIVCTLQTFPFALAAVQALAATEGKRFAVIADEAHSSQTGEAAARLKQLLSAEDWASLSGSLQDGGEIDTEALLAAQMAAKASPKGLTSIAFTATPKAKTLELFGRRDPADGPDGLPQPFHVYPMRQAIEEGFILDVLKNYTSYQLAFRLAHEGRTLDEQQVERSTAMKGLMQWVRLHPYNIAQKVQIVVEHYRENVQPMLAGRAKAMVVVASRKEAVRWQKAMRAYIARQGYMLGVLTAFSGEVDDLESYPAPVSEASADVNPALQGRDLRETFAREDQHLLVVANKFQTGFDQPLLCGMYVDKRLGGIQAVQTLSRLNRAHPGKDTTYILDFVNDPAEVLAAFQTYYQTAALDTPTDPHQVFDLRAKLDAAGHYTEAEVERVARVDLDPAGTQKQLDAAIAPVADRLLRRYKAAQGPEAQDTRDALLLFKGDLGAYVRLYAFLSQIFDYGQTALEKRFLFFRRLLPLLDFGRERDTVDLSQVVLTHHTLKNRGAQPLALTAGGSYPLAGLDGTGTGQVQEKQKDYLAEIIEKVNGLFEGELSDTDQLVYVNGVLRGKLLENALLVQQAASNSKEQFASSPDLRSALLDAIMDALDAHQTMSTQALGSERLQDGLRDVLLGPGQLWEALRARAAAGQRTGTPGSTHSIS